MNVEVTVTQADWDTAVKVLDNRGSGWMVPISRNCPVALALKRVIPSFKYCSIGAGIGLGTRWIPMPPEGVKVIQAFDSRTDFHPLPIPTFPVTFTVDVRETHTNAPTTL